MIAFDLDINPKASIDWSYDVGGNAVATAHFSQSSQSLSIRSYTRIKLYAPKWPVFAISADAASYPFSYSDDDKIDLGGLSTLQYADEAHRLSSWVEGFVLGRPTDTLSLLKDISNGVNHSVVYESRESEGTQGPLETLDRGWGSCRDFAVLFAESVRTLGFAARIVSGYLHNPSNELVGTAEAGSTHAWVEVYVPGAGWIAFDPTNRSVGSADLIAVAAARNIQQVAPVSGSYVGNPTDLCSLRVEVVVKKDDTVLV